MVAIAIRSFKGVVPKINPRNLPDSRAQIASNNDCSRGDLLTPFRAYSGTIKSGLNVNNPKTLFRYKEDYVTENNQYWLASSNDVDFCRSQIIGDTSEILYFTDNDDANVAPQFTYSAHVPASPSGSTPLLFGTLYGITQSYNLGVPAPDIAPSVIIVNTEEEPAGLSREFRSYVYTFVWKFAGREMESAPSPPSDSIGVYLESTEYVRLGLLDTTPPGAWMNSANVYIRIYRSVGGEFLFVQEVAIGSSTYNDVVVGADDLGEAIATLTWSPPPAELKGLVNMSNGIMAGFVGKDVYFCEPYIPHAWPVNYVLSVDSPIIGLGTLDTTLVILTRERPYYAQGSSPEYMTLVEADANQGCLSKRSIATLNGEVYFASPDGLMATSPRGTRNVLSQFFDVYTWRDFVGNFSSLTGATHDQKYFAHFQRIQNDGDDRSGFIFDVPSGEISTLRLGHNNTVALWADTRLDKLYELHGNKVYAFADSDSQLPVEWKSKVFTLPREISFSVMQVEFEELPFSGTRSVFIDVETEHGYVLQNYRVTSRELFRLPSQLAREWWVTIRSSGYTIFNVAMAQSSAELASV